jgi:Ca2+-binding EF-hand superfamily protein
MSSCSSCSSSYDPYAYLEQTKRHHAAGAAKNDPSEGNDPVAGIEQALADLTDTNAAPDQGGTGPVNSTSRVHSGTLAALIALQGNDASSAPGNAASKFFSQIDGDGDGQISKAELDAGAHGASNANADALFSAIDANNDGGLSKSELSAVENHGAIVSSTHANNVQATSNELEKLFRQTADSLAQTAVSVAVAVI